MGMEDIGTILKNWQYDPEHTVRVVTGNHGRLLLQVRLPLGLEQYEMDGRPDGTRPHGYETYLAYLEAARDASDDPGSWRVGEEEFSQLQQEGILMYYRYVVLFQINDFRRVARDTGHNLQLCTLLEHHCDLEARAGVLQFKPFIIRMHATARAWELSLAGRLGEALRVLDNAMEMIEGLESVPTPAFTFEKARSLSTLAGTRREMSGSGEGTLDPCEDLERQLQEAVAAEDYERAARLRDRLGEACGPGDPGPGSG